MFLNIIIFFIVLIILTLILTYSKQHKEGFLNFPDANHNTYVKESQIKFNPLSNTINLTDPNAINSNLANNIQSAVNGLSITPTQQVYKLDSNNQFTIPSQASDTIKKAQHCEKAPNNCSAFDDPIFAENCGISFDINGNSISGEPHIGGLYISPDDRQKQMAQAENVISTGSAPYDPYKVFQPTLGKAKPGTFALTKEQCTVVKEKLDCEKKQTFNSPNCAQCFTSQKFSRVGPETGRLPITMYLVGNGITSVAPQNAGDCHNWTSDELAAISNGKSQTSVCNATAGQAFQGSSKLINKCGGCWCCENVPFFLNETTLDQSNPTSMNISGNSEGTTFNIIVKTSDGSMPWIAGFIQGQTPRGTFNLDLLTLIKNDLTTNKRPKINGTKTINGFRSMVIVPGKDNQISVSGIIPFSFINVYDTNALMCDNGPIITKAESATFLESDPCYGKDNQPGDYKIECLQARWIELGGTQQGSGYPINKTTADAIQKDANGTPLSIDVIVDNLAPKMISARTGKDANGNTLNVNDWNTISKWATGKTISTPCDGANSENGPLTQDCLSYLYQNKGASSHIGRTYTLQPSSVASMKGQIIPNTYCQPGTSIDPATPEGLKFGQKLGGINAVKQTYDQINRLANDNTQKNTARSNAINQCYGVTLESPTSNNVTGPVQVFAVGPGYDVAKDEADKVCAKYGAKVATTAQVQEAQKNGADWCFTGWVADSDKAFYPITQNVLPGCGSSPGLQSWTPPFNKAGVNCYGPKPPINANPANTIFPFNQTYWDEPKDKSTSYITVDNGYLETSGEQPSCFSGLSVKQAQETCNNLGSKCAGFSYSVDGSGSGCYKGDVKGGKVNNNAYMGYIKIPQQ